MVSQSAASSAVAANIRKSSSLARKISNKISYSDSMASCKLSVFQIKQKTHQELEIEIQSSRVLYVLDELIAKLEIVACIPKLIQDNGSLLRKFLPRSEAEFVYDACSQYMLVDDVTDNDTELENQSVHSGSIRNICKPSTALRSESVRLELQKDKSIPLRDKRPDLTIQQAMAIVCANQTLKNNMREIVAKDMDELTVALIDGVRRLRAAAVRKLEISANEERERERELRKAWKENTEAKQLIAQIQEKLNKQKEELDVQLNAKDVLINAYKEKIEVLKAKFKEDIKKRVIDSEKSMIQKTQHSEEKQTQLQQDAKEITHNYWTLLDQHLASEKQLRVRKVKIEAQLSNWLAKFDQDIGEKQSEYEELQRLYDEESTELQALQTTFDEQEEEYTELMAEKDEYERQIYAEKAYIFLTNRAARRIQKFWRAYRERKRARRKAKKDRKKEKASGTSESPAESAKLPPTEAKDKAKAKGKGKGKGKKVLLGMGEDPMAKLESKFKGDILEDISSEPVPGNVSVDL